MGKKKDGKQAVEAATPTVNQVPSNPTIEDVRAELTIYWDAFSPLNLAGVRAAYDKGETLDDIGITEDQAESFVNKYNSIVMRNPGKGPLVRSTEAKKWHTSGMDKITALVTTKAQA